MSDDNRAIWPPAFWLTPSRSKGLDLINGNEVAFLVGAVDEERCAVPFHAKVDSKVALRRVEHQDRRGPRGTQDLGLLNVSKGPALVELDIVQHSELLHSGRVVVDERTVRLARPVRIPDDVSRGDDYTVCHGCGVNVAYRELGVWMNREHSDDCGVLNDDGSFYLAICQPELRDAADDEDDEPVRGCGQPYAVPAWMHPSNFGAAEAVCCDHCGEYAVTVDDATPRMDLPAWCWWPSRLGILPDADPS